MMEARNLIYGKWPDAQPIARAIFDIRRDPDLARIVELDIKAHLEEQGFPEKTSEGTPSRRD